METILKTYDRWLKEATADPDLITELKAIQGKDSEIKDRFYKSLEFGTAGLRGVIGAGTNRMNVYTVGCATQGLAEYVKQQNPNGKVAIAYDSRIKSELFARHAATVFAANGLTVYIYPELAPTPMVSFAIRYFKCNTGVVVTASHNPAEYNGYKAYGPDGCQLNLEASAAVLDIIKKVDLFDGVKTCDFDEAVKAGKINFIGQEVVNAYLDAVFAQSVADSSYHFENLKIIYTPLHGSGNKPVRAILKRLGVQNVTVVKEQELPDGNFPTAPYPNPEIRQVFEVGLKLAEQQKPDLLIATDPDSDRMGIAVRQKGEYVLMTGNEVGILMLNYLLARRSELGTLPKDPMAVTTIVSTKMVQKIAANYGCELKEVLTGFKFIGEQILLLEQKHEENRFIMGFEESYGYMAGSYVRDKDAVVASMLIAEMCCYYKDRGLTLIDQLNKLYEQYGHYNNRQKSFTCAGMDGMEKMAAALAKLRKHPPKEIGGYPVTAVTDYQTSQSVDLATGAVTPVTLPKSNVIAYTLQGGSTATVRPSGTEPKIKIYISALAQSSQKVAEITDQIELALAALLGL